MLTITTHCTIKYLRITVKLFKCLYIVTKHETCCRDTNTVWYQLSAHFHHENKWRSGNNIQRALLCLEIRVDFLPGTHAGADRFRQRVQNVCKRHRAAFVFPGLKRIQKQIQGCGMTFLFHFLGRLFKFRPLIEIGQDQLEICFDNRCKFFVLYSSGRFGAVCIRLSAFFSSELAGCP